jgi:hypothetical protein
MPSHDFATGMLWTTRQDGTSTTDKDCRAVPSSVVMTKRSSGVTTILRGSSPTSTWLPAGERYQPLGRRTLPSGSFPGKTYWRKSEHPAIERRKKRVAIDNDVFMA